MGLNDKGWEEVLAAKDRELARDGLFTITASALKELSGREPRVMAKHDFSSAVPEPLRAAGLNVLPLSRSSYLVGEFDIFHPFSAITSPVRNLSIPPGIETMGTITSEAVALNAGVIAGMLDDFLKAGPYYPTMSGRMSTGAIALRLAGTKFTVDRAQMEIDGGYESAQHLVLVEAKNHLSTDFNIRQLYFPFRRFSAVLSKPVIPIYMVYTNGLVHLYRYDFPQPLDMNSIKLTDCARYALTPSALDAPTLLAAVTATTPTECEVTFPQANNFQRVINLVELLSERAMTKAEISEEYDFSPRQADYYTAAARYLDLITDELKLTAAGRRLMDAESRDGRNLHLVRALAARPVFHEVLTQTFTRQQVPPRGDIARLIATGELSEETVARRAQTVEKWAQWALDLIPAPTLF